VRWPQVYVPFEQRTRVSAATRWQALEGLAQREQWNVVLASPAGYTMVAYGNPAGTSGVRDRIKVELFSDRTVVETGAKSKIKATGRSRQVAASTTRFRARRRWPCRSTKARPPRRARWFPAGARRWPHAERAKRNDSGWLVIHTIPVVAAA